MGCFEQSIQEDLFVNSDVPSDGYGCTSPIACVSEAPQLSHQTDAALASPDVPALPVHDGSPLEVAITVAYTAGHTTAFICPDSKKLLPPSLHQSLVSQRSEGLVLFRNTKTCHGFEASTLRDKPKHRACCFQMWPVNMDKLIFKIVQVCRSHLAAMENNIICFCFVRVQNYRFVVSMIT